MKSDRSADRRERRSDAAGKVYSEQAPVYPHVRPGMCKGQVHNFFSHSCFCFFAWLCISASLSVSQGYLERFGFMNESQKSKASLLSAEAFSDSVKEYQRFAQINETGNASK